MNDHRQAAIVLRLFQVADIDLHHRDVALLHDVPHLPREGIHLSIAIETTLTGTGNDPSHDPAHLDGHVHDPTLGPSRGLHHRAEVAEEGTHDVIVHHVEGAGEDEAQATVVTKATASGVEAGTGAAGGADERSIVCTTKVSGVRPTYAVCVGLKHGMITLEASVTSR